MESQYLNFIQRPTTGKTNLYDVVSKQNTSFSLGEIKWYGPWRKYCFYPSLSIFDSGCLNDIKRMMDGLMLARKIEKQNKSSI